MRASFLVVSTGRGTRLAARIAAHGGMVRTIYCVQPYRRTAGRLVKCDLRRLLSQDAALRAARAMKGAADGVVVFVVFGSPEADYWSEPRLIAKAGDVPADAR